MNCHHVDKLISEEATFASRIGGNRLYPVDKKIGKCIKCGHRETQQWDDPTRILIYKETKND